MKPVKTTSLEPDLVVELPASAEDYYALTTAELMRPASDIYCLKGGLLTVDYSKNWQFQFCVHNADGSNFSYVTQLYDLPKATTVCDVGGRVAIAEDRFTKFNVCHYLLDKLGRTGEYKDLTVDSFIVFDQNNYVKTVSSLLEMTLTQLPKDDDPVVTYRFDELYVSSSVFKFKHPGQNFRTESMAVIEQLRNSINSENTNTVRRLYIDRSRAPSRKIINNQEFIEFLTEYDITPVRLEDYSFSDQASLFRNADIVLGVHGAGLTNMVFNENKDAKLLEILPPLCATCDYWKLAAAYGFGYDAFIADDPEHARPNYDTWRHDPKKYNRQDVFIDIARFGAFLDLNIPESINPPLVSLAS